MYLRFYQRCLLVWQLLILSAASGAFELDEPSFLRRHEHHTQISQAEADDSDMPRIRGREGKGGEEKGEPDEPEEDKEEEEQKDDEEESKDDDDKEKDDDGGDDGDGGGDDDEDCNECNTPANPNDCGEDDPSVDSCKDMAEELTDDATCWRCFPSYRTRYCKKEALRDGGPTWCEKCAKEQSVRAVFCKEFAELPTPELQESCFFKGSEYKSMFCMHKKQTTGDGFEKKCAQDDEQGEEYCKQWADECANKYNEEVYQTCKIYPSFSELYCQKRVKTSDPWDSRCADVKGVGGAYCKQFTSEEEVRGPCAQHSEYLGTFCDTRANAKCDVELCATTDSVKENYCSVMAEKNTETTACWDVPKFADVFCHNKHDERCKKNKSPRGQKERSEEEMLEEKLEKQGKLPANYYSDASKNAREDSTIKDVDQEERGKQKRKEEKGNGENLLRDHGTSLKARGGTIGTETLDANTVDLMRERSEHLAGPLPEPSAGDVEGMDAQLPLGWRSGWDEAKARFFFFPVEEDQETGNWRPVDGADEVYEKPGTPWQLQEKETNNHAQDPIAMAIEVNKSKPQPHSGGRYFPSKKSTQLQSLEPQRTKSLMRSEREVEALAPQSDSEESFGIKASGALFKEKKQERTRHTKTKNQISKTNAEQKGDLSEMDAIGQGTAFREAVLEYQGGFPAKA